MDSQISLVLIQDSCWGGRPARMTKPYSLDLRDRVVYAVEHEGMSRHQAAARFGIAVSTAIRWVARFRKTGSAAPSKMGGYKPKTLRGDHALWLIARCHQKISLQKSLLNSH